MESQKYKTFIGFEVKSARISLKNLIIAKFGLRFRTIRDGWPRNQIRYIVFSSEEFLMQI